MMSESSLQRYFALRKKGKLKNEKGPKAAYHLLRSAVFGKALPAAVAAGAAQLCDSRSNKAELARVIKAHASAEKLRDRRWLRRIRRDIYFTKFYQWIDADEYFRYQFEDLSRAGRWLYIGEKEFIERCKLADDPEELDLTKNKYKAYCALKPYYKREAVLISSPEDKQLFNDFCDRQAVFFLKPLAEFGGHGIRRIDLNMSDDRDVIWQQILENYGQVILEQPVIQAEEMARFHPQSVNTVRVVAMNKRDGSKEIIQTSVRLGTGESVVDNGCLSASVDTETGIITSPGRAAHEKGLYLRHPDTGVQILGNAIPQWPELLSQVIEQQSTVFKNQPFIGWDMAYSVDGWVVVEVNGHPGLQILSGAGVGARALFNKALSGV